MDKKKIIWIAGGSTGIGRATAIEFIKNGWTVIINARNKDNLRISVRRNEFDDFLGYAY